jgi:hypothetical protein
MPTPWDKSLPTGVRRRNIVILALVALVMLCCLCAIVSPRSPAPVPTATPAVTATRTPAATQVPTSTPSPKPTATLAPPTPTATSDSGYVPMLGKVWRGVKVYYGTDKALGFEILGGVENCSLLPSGRGLRVRYPDGSEAWKDRNAIVDAGIYFARSDDPATRAMDWQVYPCR